MNQRFCPQNIWKFLCDATVSNWLVWMTHRSSFMCIWWSIANNSAFKFALTCLKIWIFVLYFQRNPDIKIYALPWAFPSWVGNGTNSPYKTPQRTADYVIKWIQGAKEVHNITTNYVGVRNGKIDSFLFEINPLLTFSRLNLF